MSSCIVGSPLFMTVLLTRCQCRSVRAAREAEGMRASLLSRVLQKFLQGKEGEVMRDVPNQHSGCHPARLHSGTSWWPLCCRACTLNHDVHMKERSTFGSASVVGESVQVLE
jgi:hypothetical protein